MTWLEDANGDLVNERFVVRLVTTGSDTTWSVYAKMTTGSDVPLLAGIESQVLAQDAARSMINSIQER